MDADLDKILQLMSDGKLRTVKEIALNLNINMDSALSKVRFLQSRQLLPSFTKSCNNVCNECNGKCLNNH